MSSSTGPLKGLKNKLEIYFAAAYKKPKQFESDLCKPNETDLPKLDMNPAIQL